jgi:hypothetical protein
MRISRTRENSFLYKIAQELDPHLWEQEPQEDIRGREQYEAERESDPVALLDRVISRIQSARKADVEIELAGIEEDLLALRGLLGMEESPKLEEKLPGTEREEDLPAQTERTPF